MIKKQKTSKGTKAAWRGLAAAVLTALGILMPTVTNAAYLTSLDEVTTGYYRIYSLAYNSTMAMSETSTGTNNVFVDTPNENDYMQVWKIVVSASDATTKTVTLQNVVSERWINRSNSNFHTHPTAQTYTMALTETGFIIYSGNGFHHQQSDHNVVSWGTDAAASKWQIEAVTINETALAAQKAEYSGYVSLVNNKATITTALATYFTDASCSTLKDTYTSYTDDALTTAMTNSGIPQAVINMAIKVKNSDWETYQEGWRYNEKTFRIGSYKPVSKESRWRSLVKVGYALSPNSDPTGIYVDAGDVITVYASNIPSGGSILMRNVQRQGATGDGYTLTSGFNILKMQTAGCLFVDYEVDNTTNGAASFTLLSTYPNVSIHIEGGKVNGVFSAPRGDTDADWAIMKEKLFMHYDYLQLRSRELLFNMKAELVLAACPEKMTGLLDLWDKVVEMEHNVMGLDAEFGGYFNTPMMAVSFTGSGHMYASSYGTYYNENTISDVMKYENLFNGGSLWGPAHEIGHINQAAINIIGQSEVSNNVFSNIAVFQNGHLTSRAEYISNTFKNMNDGIYWQDRGLWERTHLYFQLYQFFHVQGYMPTFYQEFFKALRANPTRRVQNVFVDATDDYLKFYKMACEVSGYDLTELFQAYGFFIVPQLKSYTASNETKDAYGVGDYGNYYLLVTQDMIDNAISEVKAMNLKKCNIVFIEDRISAPDATYTGVEAGTKKTAFSGYPFGNGDVGQYTDFVSTVAAQGYKASYAENSEGGLDVFVNHTGASGAVGFKVYDSTGKLVLLSNSYSFTVPKKIYTPMKGTAFRMVAAGADGNDQDMEAANNFVEWVVKDQDGNHLTTLFQVTSYGQQISSYPTALSAPFVSLPALTPFTYTEPITKEVVATITAPFKTSDEETAWYYHIRLGNGYVLQGVSEGKPVPALSKSFEGSALRYRWAFYGNPYKGYRIKNLATGMWLCSGTKYSTNGEHPELSTGNPTTWTIDDNCGIHVPGTSRYLNDYSGAGNNIAFWSGPSTTVINSNDVISKSIPRTTINSTSHLSSFSYDMPVIVPDDVDVFKAVAIGDNSVTVQWLDTKVVPAETGVLLYSTHGGEKKLSLGAWVDTDVENMFADNILKGTDTGYKDVEDDQQIYALRNGYTAFAKVKSGVRIPSQKAYLENNSPSASRVLSIDFSQATTAIDDILLQLPDDDEESQGESTAGFDISGRQVTKGYKGIVIRNGNKTVQR